MRFSSHRCVTRKVGPEHPLFGKVLYVPAMAEGSVEAFTSVFRWMGIEAHPTPPSDAQTRELGARFTSGDECYPAKVTAGDFLKIVLQPGFDPQRTVFMMATADGPCRFGQYAPCLRRLLREVGHEDVQIWSPRGQHGYSDIAEFGTPFLRAAWRALVSAEILRKMLLQTRPYEQVPGSADQAFRSSLADFCHSLETSCSDYECQLRTLRAALLRARDRFAGVPANYSAVRPLIGIVGEIFCRLNNFSNEELVRRLEKYGAECWMTDVPEWIAYTNAEEASNLHISGQGLSIAMLKSKLRNRIQHSDLEALYEPFTEDFRGYEESDIAEITALANRYLAFPGTEGEMVVSVGRAQYLAMHGVDGIADISPFTCMNGIVSEAVYPRLSRDYAGIPIRNFYFDGTQADVDRDVEVFLELARSYAEKKPYKRQLPPRFTQQLGAA